MAKPSLLCEDVLQLEESDVLFTYQKEGVFYMTQALMALLCKFTDGAIVIEDHLCLANDRVRVNMSL
jgi:hypothetical protein